MVPKLTASNKPLGIDPETGFPGSLAGMEKEFLRSLSALGLAAIYFSGGIPWKWLLFLFQPPSGAVLPDLCAPRPATDRGPEAEEGKGSVQCACWLCARTGSDGDCQALSLHLVWRLLLVYSVTYLVRESPQLSFPIPARGRRPLLFSTSPIGFVSVPTRVSFDHFFSADCPAAYLQDN